MTSNKHNTISVFDGKHSFLSNFYYSDFIFRGETIYTVEHFYQSQKAVKPEDTMMILHARTPGVAKRLGNSIKIRDDWDEIKVFVMMSGLRMKFHQSVRMSKLLLNTGNLHLVEGNHWHDNYWGDCTCKKCVDIKGENWLGQLLMMVRGEIKSLNGLMINSYTKMQRG